MNSAVVHSEQASALKSNAIEPRLLEVAKNEQFATRRKLLRSQVVVDDEEDDSVDDSSERALPGTSKLAELASKFSGSQKLSNKLWLKARENPDNVFKKLKLHKAGGQLGDAPQLLQWLKYVEEYRKKINHNIAFADYQVYFKLLDILPEAKVATLLQSLKQVPEIKSLAKGVQLNQYELWFGRTRNSPGYCKDVGGENLTFGFVIERPDVYGSDRIYGAVRAILDTVGR